MEAIADQFDKTTILVPMSSGTILGTYFENPRVKVIPLSPPWCSGVLRKIFFPAWVVFNLPRWWAPLKRANGIHSPIPGDVGTLGMFLASLFRKPLFVRYCGNWTHRRTVSEHLWHWWMKRLDPRGNLVVATGGGAEPPEKGLAHIQWIFSTTIRQAELVELSQRAVKRAHRPGAPKLVFAGRLEAQKGVLAIIEAWQGIQRRFPHATLDILGSGSLSTVIANQILTLTGISLHGSIPRNEVINILVERHIFLFPTSSSEGFPKVVHEAMACGLPVIATPVSVLRSLVTPDFGILLENTHPQALIEAIDTCYSNETAYAKRVVSALHAATPYSIEVWGKLIGQQLSSVWGPLRE